VKSGYKAFSGYNLRSPKRRFYPGCDADEVLNLASAWLAKSCRLEKWDVFGDSRNGQQD
jgi:hypothetical protein